MSIVLNSFKQNLIAQRNNAQYNLFHNNARKLSMLGRLNASSDMRSLCNYENSIDMDNTMLSTQLAAINVELASIKDSSGFKLDFGA